MGVELGAQLFDWREPEAGQKAGFGKWKNPKSPYDLFIEAQGIPIYRDIGVHKVQDLALAPWKRLGGRGIAIQLLGTEGLWGMYVVEVPGAGALNPERHLYEEIYYVVEGRGTTEVWQEGKGKKVTFEWSRGSLFAIPLNTWHQVVNATSSPALLLAATTAPNIVNLMRDAEFVMNCPYNFLNRFDASNDYFKPVEDIYADPVRGLQDINVALERLIARGEVVDLAEATAAEAESDALDEDEEDPDLDEESDDEPEGDA